MVVIIILYWLLEGSLETLQMDKNSNQLAICGRWTKNWMRGLLVKHSEDRFCRDIAKG